LLFAVVSVDEILKVLVDNETRPIFVSALLKFNLFLLEVVDVGALGSYSLEVNISRNSASGDLGELSINIKGEGAKLADID
jgi:hypothetical protein